MIFNKNDLINETLDKHFETWMHTLNTSDYVPTRYLKYIDRVIFDNFKKKLKEVDIYNLLYLELQGYKLGFWDKLKISFSGLKPLFNNELKSEFVAEEKVTEQQPNDSDNLELKTADTADEQQSNDSNNPELKSKLNIN